MKRTSPKVRRITIAKQETTLDVLQDMHPVSQDRHDPARLRPEKPERLPTGKILGGVCVGLAKYFCISPWLMRFLFALSSLKFGIGIVAYLVLWIALREAPNDSPTLNDGGTESEQSLNLRNRVVLGIGLLLIGLVLSLDTELSNVKLGDLAALMLFLSGSWFLGSGLKAKTTTYVL